VAADPARLAIYQEQHPQADWDARPFYVAEGCGEKQYYMCGEYVPNPDGSVSPTCESIAPKGASDPDTFPLGTRWATSVVSASSEFAPTYWGAKQILGAPDTYPSCGDNASAWASKTPDGGPESITVGFDPPASGDAVWIVETFNPDAVSRVTVTSDEGTRSIYQGTPHRVDAECARVLKIPTGSASPIHQIRIDLASDQVRGFNELDAVGVVPSLSTRTAAL
jgi:hypothetical protein